ncbi:hypothetical protein GGF44_000203 [Coemansia sp. RSA 1694]|nr:hypothetical protein GGF38_000956 [Coemansia sp. RSA 25]KAJ2507343.1 hypothetical protein IWW47_001150 [Coemansia sp. RSA 2052]KAJ2645068.1 hypothetical protein GGF44_000203 [Coemansia sp. RSA 1694]
MDNMPGNARYAEAIDSYGEGMDSYTNVENPDWQRYAHYTTTINREHKASKASKAGKPLPRAKTPWTAEENRNLFRAMAEYIYVDKQGMKPLAIYLNPTELDHVESCESALNMSDDDIASSLLENGLEVNPNRRSDLLFHVLRHLQRASGNQSTRVVNEKVKNARSRIVNLFMNMYNDGDLPSKRPVRYVSALLTSLVSSPFFPLDALDQATAANVYSMSDARHDVCLWLEAMFWLHPKAMYEFISQCALQIVRAQAERIPMHSRTAEEHNVLSEAPEYRTIIAQLHELIVILSGCGPAKAAKIMQSSPDRVSGIKRGPLDEFGFGNEEKNAAFGEGAEDLLPKRRKRKTQTVDSRKLGNGNEIEVATNDGVKVSLTLFDLLKTEEKLLLAGISIRMIAAAGGVIRNSHQALLDIKYHMYRLWTCVSRLADVAQMFQSTHPPSGGKYPEAGEGMFAEFVVVKYFTGPFEQSNIEPRVRVSKDRTPCPGGLHSLERLIEKAFASTEEEARAEVPVWLVVTKRQDERYVLALMVTSPEIEVPVDDSGVSMFHSRYYSDQMLASAIDSAIVSEGNTMMGTLPIQLHSGLDPWPWVPGQAQSISVEAGFIGHIPMASESNETLIVATVNYRGINKADPWHEPRIMTEVIFDCQQSYANLGIAGHAPLYQHLLQSGNIEAMTAAASTVAALTRNHSPMLLPSNPSAFTILNDDIGQLDQPLYYDQVPHDILPLDFGQAYHPDLGITAPNSAAIMGAGPINGNLPLATPSANSLLLSPHPYFANGFIDNYPPPQNTWVPENFGPPDSYPQFFEQFDGPDYHL